VDTSTLDRSGQTSRFYSREPKDGRECNKIPEPCPDGIRAEGLYYEGYVADSRRFRFDQGRDGSVYELIAQAVSGFDGQAEPFGQTSETSSPVGRPIVPRRNDRAEGFVDLCLHAEKERSLRSGQPSHYVRLAREPESIQRGLSLEDRFREHGFCKGRIGIEYGTNRRRDVSGGAPAVSGLVGRTPLFPIDGLAEEWNDVLGLPENRFIAAEQKLRHLLSSPLIHISVTYPAWLGSATRTTNIDFELSFRAERRPNA
jgi:hypothetical protein